jgi:hypothetical protein
MANQQDNTDDWILLHEARALVTDFYLAPTFSAGWLLQRLRTGQLRWRYWGRRVVGLSSPPSTDDGPINGDPAFWEGRTQVFWDESWAKLTIKSRPALILGTKRVVESWQGVEVFRIEVPRAEVRALLSAVRSTSKPQKRAGPKASGVIEVLLHLFPPEGRPPIDLKPNAIAACVNKELKNREKPPASRDVVRRVLKELGFR